MGSIVRSTVNVAPRGQTPRWYDVYVSFFGEGVFFVYTPAEDDKDALMNLLARRDIVIRDLLKKRRPYQTPTHTEFTVLGDTVNMAGRLSDFARQGSTWVSKAMLGKLSSKERQQVRYGIRRIGADGSEILVPETFSRVSNLVDLNDAKNHKFNDIAVMAVTEVLDVEPVQKKA